MARSPRDFIARFLSDTSKFDTSEAANELDTLGENAEVTGDKLDSLGDESKRTADKIDDSFDRIRASSKRGMDDVGKNVDEGGSRIKDTGSEVGSEFAENIGEGMRSGDYVGVMTETATSLTAALGPIGLGIGLGAAIIGGMVSGARARAEELRAATQEWVQIYKDAGALVIEEQTITDAALDKLTGDQADKYEESAERIGVSAGTLARALSGDAEAAREVDEALGIAGATVQATDGHIEIYGRTAVRVGEKNRDLAKDVDWVTEAMEQQAAASDKAYEAMLRVHGSTQGEIDLLLAMKDAFYRNDVQAALRFEFQAEKANQRAASAKRAVP